MTAFHPVVLASWAWNQLLQCKLQNCGFLSFRLYLLASIHRGHLGSPPSFCVSLYSHGFYLFTVLTVNYNLYWCSDLANESPFKIAPASFVTWAHQFWCVSWFSTFPCISGINHFSKKLWFLLVGNGVQKQNQYCWVVVASRPFQWPDLRRIFKMNHVFMLVLIQT